MTTPDERLTSIIRARDFIRSLTDPKQTPKVPMKIRKEAGRNEMIHQLKIWPCYYQAVESGDKTFEVRNNDRAFQKGDTVELLEFDPDKTTFHDSGTPQGIHDYTTQGAYTGSRLTFKIGYVLPIDSERVVFSLLKPEQSQESGEK